MSGTATIPPVGVNNFYNLLGVGHVHTFAGDVEFPAVVPELHLFARFVNGTGVMRFEVELVWLDTSGSERGVENLGLMQVTFRPRELMLAFAPLRGGSLAAEWLGEVNPAVREAAAGFEGAELKSVEVVAE